MSEFNAALDKISKLDSKVSSFCSSISQSIIETGRSALDRVDSENPHSNAGKYTSKTHIVDASKFLQGLHQRLSSAESSLVPLVDLLLDVDDEGGAGYDHDAELETKFQRPSNGQRKIHKMQLSDLSRELRCLHALHAKHILHIESLLVSQHGYITSSQQEENDDYSIGQPTPALTTASDAHSSSPLNFLLQVHDRENSFQPTPLHGPLPRLSEVTLETDGGTPLSTIMTGRHCLEKSLTPLSRQNSAGNTHGFGPLKSLKEDMNMEIMTLGSPLKNELDHINENQNISSGDYQDDSVSTSEADSDILDTPSLDKLQLSAATINILQKNNQNANDDSGEKSPCINVVTNDLNMDETKQQSDQSINESRDSSIFESCGDDESVYDSCEETLEDSEYVSTDESVEEDEDEDLLDATTSTTSTVVRNVEILKKEEGIKMENKCKYVGNRSGDTDKEEARENRSVGLTYVAIEDTANLPDVTSILDTARIDANETSHQIDFHGTFDCGDNGFTNSMQPYKDLHTPDNVSTINAKYNEKIDESIETLPPTFLIETESSLKNTNGSSTSMSEYSIGQNIDELDFRKGGHDTNKSTQSNELVATSPLDRFQVQVFNGGKECKVTPIGDDILKSAQSPILKSRSPLLGNSSSSRDSHQAKLMQSNEGDDLSHYDGSIDDEETESFYSSSSSANGISSVKATLNNSRRNRDSIHVRDSNDADILAIDIENNMECRQQKSRRSSTAIHLDKDPEVITGTQKMLGVPPTNAQQNIIGLITSENPTIHYSNENANISSMRTPRAAAFIAKHMSDEKDRLLGVLNKSITTSPTKHFQSEKKYSDTMTYQDSSPYSHDRTLTDSLNKSHSQISEFNLDVDPRLIENVAADEYDSAPPIIKKLVSREDLNQGIFIINNWLISHDNVVPSSLPESVALDILGKSFDTSQVKRICLSLCSLQRMMICRKSLVSGESVMHYVILSKRNSICP